MTNTVKRNTWLIVAMAIGLVWAMVTPVLQANALSNTSLLLSNPQPSTSSNYTFTSSSFSTGTTIRCIDLRLNTLADGTGSAVGTSTSSTLTSSSVITTGSWTYDNSTNGRLRLTNATGETPAASGNIVFGGITNGSTADTTYYGIFTSYSDVSCTGGNEVDQATVAYLFTNGKQVQLTVDPTLTFTCAGVASGQSVNGATTTVTSTASGIDYLNDVTFAANGISAHDLQVSTNATNGYTVYVRESGQLTNGSDTIADWTGTNAAPTTISGAGSELWAYTTEDSTLSGGTADRFTNGGPFWAGFSTTNAPVVDNSGATTGTQTTRVGQQVGVSTTTPAGTYQTTIIYTAASYY